MKTIVGNLFEHCGKDNVIDLIVHGCNSQGRMGSGFAKELRARYPEAYEVYNKRYNEHGLEMGEVVYYIHPSENIMIANAITQNNYGYDGAKYASYDAVDVCFKNINQQLLNLLGSGFQVRLNFPLIGCDLGGLKWEVVEQIIAVNITAPVEMNLFKLK